MTIFRRLCLITEMALVVGAAVACGASGATEEADAQRNFAWATVATALGGPPTPPRPTPRAPTPTPAPPPAPTCTLTLTAMINAHVRSRPGLAEEDIIDTLPAGESAPIVGRLPSEPTWTASSWWLIRLDDGRYGWVGSTVVTLDGCPVAPGIVSPVQATN